MPVWKAQQGQRAELGWWGMELAKRLVESQKVPIFMINAAVGGTRIDQHQRNAMNPTDLSSIYGRMLWRIREAKLTHGIRAILWHQGENDQGSDGPTGGYGWETYHEYFVDMAAGWKQDFPNVQRYYVFQIWPNSCSMGGRQGSGDMLREKQRQLEKLSVRLGSNFSRMEGSRGQWIGGDFFDPQIIDRLIDQLIGIGDKLRHRGESAEKSLGLEDRLAERVDRGDIQQIGILQSLADAIALVGEVEFIICSQTMNSLVFGGFIGSRVRIEPLQNLACALSEFAGRVVGESDQQDFANARDGSV
jgi:hypothetical protein